MGDWDGLPTLLDAVERELGPCDLLVNNAGIAPLYPGLDEVSEELFDKVMAVNLKGPFRLMALAGKRMGEKGGGSIINISSIASVRPTPDDLPYAAAKAGLNTLTAGFAQALGPSVRVNTILAGPFYTDISKAWDLEAFEEAASHYPLRRGGRPGGDRRCGDLPGRSGVELHDGRGPGRRRRPHCPSLAPHGLARARRRGPAPRCCAGPSAAGRPCLRSRGGHDDLLLSPGVDEAQYRVDGADDLPCLRLPSCGRTVPGPTPRTTAFRLYVSFSIPQEH